MSPVPVTSLYAVVLAFPFLGLSAAVILRRRAAGVVLGTGDDELLLRAVRAQANFSEYVPLALLLMALAEFGGVTRALLHLAGLVLVIARILHAYGLSRSTENLRFRVAGIGGTFTATAGLALAIVAHVALG